MERIKNNIFFNLSNTMLKIIGLVCMTIDHLYLYVFANTTINVSIFRIVGRIAAPLFLFAVIQAMRYSSDKKSYIFRLYKYHICICILEIVLSYLLHSEISFNVIPEWLFTAIYIYLIDMIIKKEHIIRHIVLMLIPILVGIGSLIIGPSCSVINVFLPNIFTIQYSPFFLILGIGWYYMKKKKNFTLGKDWTTQFQLHTLMLPGTVCIIVFSILPLFGLILAFKNYSVVEGVAGIFTSKWYGFQNFKIIFGNHDFTRMLVNTLGINLLGNLINIPAALFFALLINEIASPFLKKSVQTLTYMPHFISWVVFGGIIITLLSSDGPINRFLTEIGILSSPIVFMAQPGNFWAIAIISNLIKELGWSTILYTAAIAGVDQELYEAAAIDGAGRFRRMVSITIPCIKGTIMIMVIFAVAGILNNNFDQIYVLQNSFNLERSEVIDTYIYKIGIQQLQFGMAAAVNITKSFFSLALLLLANAIVSKLSDGYGLF